MVDQPCTPYSFLEYFDYIFIMYSAYTTHFTHNIQFVYPVYNLYCIVHTDYTDSQQLYVDYIFHYMYRMCVKINVLYVQCTVTYCIYMHIPQYAFYLP